LVFRGENFDNLASKLSSHKDEISEEKMLSLLFYFGDKAKHFYKNDDQKAGQSRWIKKIEDTSVESGVVIFEKIRTILRKNNPEIKEFNEYNPCFFNFFTKNENKAYFSDRIANDQYIRDYYLYFLHTAGKIGIGDKSLLVSTSRCYDVANHFSSNAGTRYIIYYVIPSPSHNFAVSHLFHPPKILCSVMHVDLPTFAGKSLYPAQNEVAIKGALFSHHILGVMAISPDNEEVFVANPHLFNKQNSHTSILRGLRIDQSDFYNKLKKTNYYRGVGTYLDGNYHTLNI
ncbi:MAG TPA: hypothetical protein VJ499_17400, partial [Flavisolibacter sp.]|nr:hypothetical protein [Flavisolibacter sp.]